jgi:heptosyltransferase II
VVELAQAPERIVVVQPASLGEVLFAGPLVRVLKLAWPKARLTLVTSPPAAAVAGCLPSVDKVVAFDPVGERGYAGLKRVALALGEPQLVVVAHASLRSALLAWLTKAAVRVGNESTVKGRFFTVKVPLREREPFVERAMDLARALGVEGPTELQLRAPPDGLARVREKLGEKRAVGLLVGAERKTARWPAESLAALADRLDEAGYQPVLLGTPDERPLAELVQAASRRARPLPLLAEPLEVLCAAALLDGVVGGDCGLAHVARAVGTPTLMLFGPSDPGAHTLEAHVQALRLGIDCQPCAAKGEEDCPLSHHGCMRNLEVDRVFAALCDLMARGARR